MRKLSEQFDSILTFFKSKQKGNKDAREVGKPAPILPTECMQRIFQYIQETPNSKLYPSLLVNRYWSKNVVSFLWNRPFRLCSKKNRYKLISTLLMFFSLEETNNSKLKVYNIIIPAQRNPIFNYSAMIREIYYMDLEKFTSSYLKKITFSQGSNIMHQKLQILFITGCLFQMFLHQSTNLETLVIDKEIYTMDLPDISIFTESNSNLTKLTKLRIDYDNLKTRNITHLLKYISEMCDGIQILEFKFNTDAYDAELLQSISETVKSQKGLREFSLSNVNTGIDLVMISLLAHVDTLTSISLAFVKLDQTTMDILLNLNRLKELRLWFCEGLDNLTVIHTLELDTLHLVELSTKITHSILQPTGNSIKQLGLNINHIENLDVALQYCPNLEEIILVYLSDEKRNEKVVNKLEKPWKQKLTLYKEISTKTLIYQLQR
jgi:hypothetical protein